MGYDGRTQHGNRVNHIGRFIQICPVQPQYTHRRGEIRREYRAKGQESRGKSCQNVSAGEFQRGSSLEDTAYSRGSEAHAAISVRTKAIAI